MMRTHRTAGSDPLCQEEFYRADLWGEIWFDYKRDIDEMAGEGVAIARDANGRWHTVDLNHCLCCYEADDCFWSRMRDSLESSESPESFATFGEALFGAPDHLRDRLASLIEEVLFVAMEGGR